MIFIEGGLQKTYLNKKDIEKGILSLKRQGIDGLLFSDFFSLRDFYKIGINPSCIGKLYVISHPHRDSIKLIWNLIKNYESFFIFIEYRDSDEDFLKDSLYKGLSLTDDIGVAIESKGLSSFIKNRTEQAIQDEFKIKEFLILDRDGLDLPFEILRSIRKFRSKLLGGSKIFYFPNDSNGLGIINSLYAMKGRIDGLVGSVLKDEKESSICVDLLKISSIYRWHKENLFTERKRRILDKSFSRLNPLNSLVAHEDNKGGIIRFDLKGN
jgi:hypothetical protein